MKKHFILTLFALSPLFSMADEESSMIVSQTDGSNITVELSSLQSIKFSNGSMLICRKDKTQQAVSISDIKVITFSSVASAIETLVGEESQDITITDLSGRTIFKGSSASTERPRTLHGTYIITVGRKSHKVAFK